MEEKIKFSPFDELDKKCYLINFSQIIFWDIINR